MDIRQAIFNELDQGRICVFPTENLSRFYLQEYARFSKKGMVFSSQAIAWDKFYDQLLPKFPDLKPSNDITRRLFCAKFTSSDQVQHLSGLTSLPQYRLTSYIKRILTQLKLAENIGEEKIRHDVKVILSAYNAFLNECGLYEKKYLTPTLSSLQDQEYVVCFPEVIKQFPLLIHQLGENKLRTIGSDGLIVNDLTLFPNSLSELKVQLRKIRGLLDDGVNINDIAITCLNLETTRPYLEREAPLYGIPINIVENLKLTSYSSGKFFSDVKSLLDEDYSMRTMQALLLNPSYPFSNPEALRALVKDGIDNRIVSGRSHWLALKGESHQLFKSLEETLGKFSTARKVSQIREHFNSFQDKFFFKGAFNEASELSKHVYSYCVRQLDSLDKGMADSHLVELKGLFSLWVQILQETSYVPQQQNSGIRVYAYPQSAGLTTPYHFVMSIDDQAARQKTRYVDFLPESQDGEFYTTPIERTDSVLALYSASGENVYLSGSRDTFSGAALCPPVFMAQGRRKSYLDQGLQDEYEAETEHWAEGKQGFLPNSVQKAGFEAFRENYLSPIAFDPPEDSSNREFSSTSMDSYLKCPFAYKCRYILNVSDLEYAPSIEDFRKRGYFVHEIFEEFFTRIGVVNASRAEEYDALLLKILEERFPKYSDNAKVGPEVLEYEKNALKRSLEGGMDYSKLDGFEAYSTEKNLRVEEDGYSLNGRVDLIFRSSDSKTGVLDIKSGSLYGNRKKININDIEENGLASVQLMVYNRLLSRENGGYASFAAYYSLKDRKFYFGWEALEQATISDEILKDKATQMLAALDSQTFETTENSDNCINCEYFSVCRKRYVVR